MVDDIETTGSAYFHIGNGGVTFSVHREPEGPYGNGPHLCVSGSSHGTKMLGVDIQTTPDSLRALGLEFLEAATENYPRSSSGALTTTGSMPRYEPWDWAEFPFNGKENLAKMRQGEPIEELEKKRSRQEKQFYEKAERLQKRVAILRAEAERLETELTEHRLHTPKMWKRCQDGMWVDHEQLDLAELMEARAKLRILSHEDPESVHQAVEGLTVMLRLIQCDDPWRMEISVIYVGGWPSEKWAEFAGCVRQRADEEGWVVKETEVLSRGRSGPSIKHRIRVSRGSGVIEIEQCV